jgi:hypothetical protein
MVLKAVLTQEEFDAVTEPAIQELFTKKGDDFELTGIQGVKTQKDVDRLNEGIRKERETTADVKTKLAGWAELGELEEVQTKLDRYPELELAAKDKFDETEVEAAVERRVEATIKTRLAPVERENKKLKTQIDEGLGELTTLRGEKTQRSIHDALDKAMTTAKVLPEYREDVRLWGERVMEVNEDSEVITKDGVGVTPGMGAETWLEEMLPKRPGWLQPSRGGGARGSDRSFAGGSNPWAEDHWNVTDQGKVIRDKGMETANKMAASANSRIGATSATKKK